MPLPSDTSVIYDTVTILHFAAAGRLDLLRQLHGHRPEPRWLESVKAEIVKGQFHRESKAWCDAILAEAWLGDPVEADVMDTLDMQIALSEPGILQRYPKKNLGEAESIVYSIETGATFITDDRGAYDFAGNPGQLGPGRVLDACQLIDAAVVEMYITESDRRDFHRAVAAAGREMHCNCVF